MSNPLVSATTRRLAVALAVATLAAGAAEAQPQRPRAAVPETSAGDSFGDFLMRFLAGVLGNAENDLEPAAERSELDSEIEVDPPNPVIQPVEPVNGGRGLSVR